MLQDLKWNTLETMRKKARLIMMYKMSHGLLDINLEQYLILSKETRTRGSHKLKYQIPKVTKDVFKFSFFPRTLKDWNNLPEEIVVSDSLNIFKDRLSTYLV